MEFKELKLHYKQLRKSTMILEFFQTLPLELTSGRQRQAKPTYNLILGRQREFLSRPYLQEEKLLSESFALSFLNE